MSQIHEYTSLWWPDERIKSTLNAKYIVSRLRPENIPRLFKLPDWGEGLTSETYMEWILTKAGRVFLILEAIGIPDRIFALVDKSCDDGDLPVAEHSVDLLCLSPDGEDIELDTRFFHAQWRFLARGIAEGEHVVYTENEGVPVEAVRSHISGLHGRDDSADKVILAGSVCRVYMRTQVQVGGAPHFFSSDEVLAEIRHLRKLSHEHLVSVYASYLKDDSVSVLFTGATADRNLHGFLTDEPLVFKRLAKEQRRQTLITWPHCLASAVCWLHARGYSHGAIRPSNIFIDEKFHISLGQFQALDSLLAPPHVNDLEAYNYSAPERWIQAPVPTIRRPQPTQTPLPSGGRSNRKRPSRIALAPSKEKESPLPSDPPRPDSAASKGTVIRIGLPNSPSRFSFAFSSSSSSSASSRASSIYTPQTTTPKQHRLSTLWPRNPRSTPPITSSPTSPLLPSRSSHSRPRPDHPNSPADIFSLAATTLDILTTLHKRSLHSFAAHRSARNRSAGRGGGIADASFHLARNAVQVQSWIALLEGDALKRCRRERRSDRAFWAVPRMLIVVRAMLDAEGRRPGARRVRRCFEEAILREGGEGLVHCGGEGMDGRSRVGSVVPSESASEFDFGFLDASESGSDVERVAEGDGDGEDQQVSPQLYLPELDMNITGIEGLTVNHGRVGDVR